MPAARSKTRDCAMACRAASAQGAGVDPRRLLNPIGGIDPLIDDVTGATASMAAGPRRRPSKWSDAA